ncbi:MAG TPA: lysylphosphatidylglycerol synthase domain-containing protein [Gemmataceae bacterium]|nr:lysylphosphatidylglycerol synthase domain-containing protein [Gemmataceae bacterium]
MSWNPKRAWLVLKTAVAVAILVAVGRNFAITLSSPELASFPFRLRFAFLVPAGLLYLLAHCCWASFWVRLLRSQGVHVSWYGGLRAYFVSQFGKYVPGKAWVILLRVGMLRAVGGRPLPVAVTATYETLSSMAAGALLGVLLLPWLVALPDVVSGNVVALAAIAGLPIVLGVLNKLVVRVAQRSREPDAPSLPSPSVFLLAQGLLHGACGWCLLGVSLGLTVRAVAPEPAKVGVGFLGDVAAVTLAYVVGFVMLWAPGGLGPREYVLKLLLGPRFEPTLGQPLADGLAVVIALVLRLTWTTAEVALALALYLRPATPAPLAEDVGKEEVHA